LALFLNIDSIQLFSFYTTNTAAREAVIHYYQQNADTLNGLANRMQFTGSTNTDSALNVIAPFMQSDASTQMDSMLMQMRRQNTTIVAAPIVLDNQAAKAAADSIAAAKKGINNKADTTGIQADSVAHIPIHNPVVDTLNILSKNFITQVDSLRKTANLPVGFQYSIFKQPVHWFYPFLLKLLGILISGLAASFGGPFWFDVLRKIYTRK